MPHTCGCAAAISKRPGELEPPQLPCGDESACDAGHKRRQHRKDDDAAVDGDVGDAGKVRREQRWQCEMQTNAQRQAGSTAGEAEQNVLEHQLPRELPCAGADRGTDGELTTLGGRSCQLNTGDVGRRGHQ